MYSSMTGDDYRAALAFPEDYCVEGVVVTGVWDLFSPAHTELVELAVGEATGCDAILERLPGPQLGHGYQFFVGGKRYWWVPVMGTAVMAQYLHVASLLGSKKNLLCGVVGGLREGMKTGDLVVPSASFGNDNALMYERDRVDKMFYPDTVLRSSLLARVGEERIPDGVQLFEGVTTTCEVMFAESHDDVKNWSAAGMLGVEMEAAMVFALSNSFGIPSAAVFAVADNLIEEESFFSAGYASSSDLRWKVRQLQYNAIMKELLSS